ncbi:hypothetical protein [Nostoc sp. MS1]|uniref:hypothetical protein n=1 Tax=Nostoc sp. MS1 TaxID=2764711 RepID=UPI001CC68819|nr:hypothetical protein [Nostoc sp. MS1]BCL39467.1 hypothetical protein NSMS1_59140 [Nostoc sp. MS1]
MVSIVIKGGWFHQILGKSAQNAGFAFIAVLGDLENGTQVNTYPNVDEKFVFPLSNYIDDKSTDILLIDTDVFAEPVNEVWVRARVPAIFGFNILFSQFVPDYKYGLIGQTFIACEQKSTGDWEAYLFICEGYNLSAKLRFYPDDSLIETYKSIAKAFWELLLLEPEHICTFCDGYLHYNEFDDEEWHNVVFNRGQVSMETISPVFW